MSRAKYKGKTVSPHKLAALNFTGKTAEDTPPPESLGGQEGALSCIMQEANQGGGGEAEMLDQLCSANFRDPRCREIYAHVLTLQEEGRPPDIMWLDKKLSEDLRDYARSILETAPSPANFPRYLEDIKDATTRYEWWQFAQYAKQLVNDTNRSPDTISADLQERMSEFGPGESPSFPSILNAADLQKMDIPTPPEVISGTLHQGGKMFISAPPKIGKTWLLMDLAISVSNGIKWWGKETTQTGVLYVNFELEQWEVKKRLSKILAAKQEGNLDQLDILSFKGVPVDVESLRSILRRQLKQKSYGLIIVDPIYKVYGERCENSATDMADLMNHIGAIIKEFKAAVVFVAHQTKGNQSGKETRDRIAGSGVFVRDPDSLVYLTEHEEEGCYIVSSITRSFPPQDEFVMRWEFPLMVREDDMNPERLKARRSGNPAKHHSVEEIMAHVPHDKPIDKNELRGKASKAKIALNKINPLIDQAVEEGLLYVHLIPRSGTCPKKRLARYPQEQQQDFHDSHDLNA